MHHGLLFALADFYCSTVLVKLDWLFLLTAGGGRKGRAERVKHYVGKAAYLTLDARPQSVCYKNIIRRP